MKKLAVSKVLCGVLSLSMLAGLTACSFGKGGNGGLFGGSGGKTVTDPALAKQGVYKNAELDLGLGHYDYLNFNCGKVVGDKFYAVVNVVDYSKSGSDNYVISMNSDGTGIKSSMLEEPGTDDLEVSVYSDDYYYYDDDYYYDDIYYEDEDVVYEDAVGDLDDAPASVPAFEIYPTDDEAPVYTGKDVVEDKYEYAYYNNIYFDNDGNILGLVEVSVSGSIDGSYAYGSATYLAKWDSDGNIVWKTDLCEFFDTEYVYFYMAGVLSSGEYYAVYDNGEGAKYYVFDEGAVKSESKFDDTFIYNISSIFVMPDGRTIVFYYDETNNWEITAAYMDAATGALKEKIDIPYQVSSNAYNMSACGDNAVVYSGGDGVYYYEFGQSESSLLMSFINSDLDATYLNQLHMLDKEHLIASYYSINDSTNKIGFFTYVDPDTIPDKTTIRIATSYLTYDLTRNVIDFNKKSDEYRIVVDDYSKYATEDDYNAGLTKLNNEIIAGNVPDIMMVYVSSFDIAAYADKGLLVEINKLIADDPELKDVEFLTNVFEAYSYKGKQYMLIPDFYYTTYMGSAKYLSGCENWTIDQFLDVMKKNPESTFTCYLDRNSFLNNVMYYDGSEFVDAETGKCDFNSGDFAKLLEYAKTLPEEFNWDEMPDDFWMNEADYYRSGKFMTVCAYLYDPSYYQQQKYSYYGGDTVLCGFPSRTGESAIIEASSMPIVLFDNGNVDGAWEFARRFLAEDYQDERYSVPVRKSSFDKWLKAATERPYWTNEDGEKEYYDNYYYVDGVSYVVPTLTDEEAKEIETMIRSCTKKAYTNEQILAIIEEEAASYFSGSKSVDEVISVIQSRVQLYINENS